jgi:hypothetical protein
MTRRMPITNMFCEKAARDVELIKRDARVVVLISVENKVQIYHNLEFKINTIGIIGPGTSPSGHLFQEALLEEIGISRTRPYHKGKVPEACQKEGEPKAITYRYGGFFLTKEQYLAVAPAVFGIIQQLADQRVAQWQSGTPDNKFYVSGAKSWYNKTAERLEFQSTKSGTVEIDTGARFSVSLEGFFAQDILRTGLLPVKKFARLINLRLSHRLDRKPRRKKNPEKLSFPRGRKPIDKLSRFSEVKQLIAKSGLPKWLLLNIVLFLPGGDNNLFASPIRQFLKWQEKTTREFEIASRVLPGLRARIGSMRLNLKRLNQDTGYCVFEVLPSDDWWKYKPLEEGRRDAELPF